MSSHLVYILDIFYIYTTHALDVESFYPGIAGIKIGKLIFSERFFSNYFVQYIPESIFRNNAEDTFEGYYFSFLFILHLLLVLFVMNQESFTS